MSSITLDNLQNLFTFYFVIISRIRNVLYFYFFICVAMSKFLSKAKNALFALPVVGWLLALVWVTVDTGTYMVTLETADVSTITSGVVGAYSSVLWIFIKILPVLLIAFGIMMAISFIRRAILKRRK